MTLFAEPENAGKRLLPKYMPKGASLVIATGQKDR